MKIHYIIANKAQPAIQRVVNELTDFIWQEDWRIVSVIGYYLGIENDLEDSKEYFENLQYPKDN